ncbi:hypothetical protein B0A55_10616, partial [Friedmanniomyces simplex]
MSQLLTEYFVSGFTVLVPVIVPALSIPPAATTWPASVFSLAVSAFLLPFGRLADIYGFAQTQIMLVVCRALQGLGPAAYLPAGLTLLGSLYRPGPRKNLVFSIYGAMAPLGFFIGIFFAGIAGQYAGWRWYFWIGAILTFFTTIIACFTIPSDVQARRGMGVKMDWLGSLTSSSGLIFLIFSITDSSHAPNRWATPYIYVCLLLGLLLLLLAFYVEWKVALQPLLPLSIFQIKYMKPFILGLLFAYGTLGIYVLYATLYIENIMGVEPLRTVAWYVPFGLGGCILATLGGYVLHKISGTIMMFITGVAIMLDSLLFALAPVGANYWAWFFPAMISATVAIDLIFNVANIFFSTNLPERQQGLAGALSNMLLQLSIAILLGFADIVSTYTADQGQRQSYKNVFWFELACGGVALVVFMGFVRIEKAKSDLTADEKEEGVLSVR